MDLIKEDIKSYQKELEYFEKWYPHMERERIKLLREIVENMKILSELPIKKGNVT